MNPLRIAYVCADPGVPVFGRKGCSIHVQEVIRALRKQGAQVSLFASRLDAAPSPGLENLPTHPLPCPRKGALEAREQACQQANEELRRLLDQMGPFDLIYERYSLWSVAGMQYARDRGIPGLLEVNAPLIEEQLAHRGLVDPTSAEESAACAFDAASALLAVSDGVADWLCATGADPARIHVVENGVNPDRFSAPEAPAPRRPSGASTFTVGFVGTLKPWHGLPLLLQAFHQAHQLVADSRLLVVGDGPERSALEQQRAQLGLGASVHFTGAVAPEFIPELLASMDAAVAPYPQSDHFYFSPLKVYEYLAAGRATVTSRLGQLARLIRHEENGLLCEPGDVADLSRQLLRLHQNPTLRGRLGAAARKTILKAHTWDHVAARILGLATGSERRREPSALSR